MTPKVTVNKITIEGTIYPPGAKEPWSSTVNTYEVTCLDPECGYQDGFLDPGMAIDAQNKHLNEKHGQV